MISGMRRRGLLRFLPFQSPPPSRHRVSANGASFEVGECDRDTFIWTSVSINVAGGIN